MTERNTSTDRETVVVTDSGRSGGGSGAGIIVGILIVIIVLAAIWFFALGPRSSGTTNINGPTINVEVPSAAPASEAPAAS
ncbi:MAG: hypothetical protein QOJ75_227 [Chloroflexota bacterium]|jgi:hypothetical protein|nr:hypothetical protein [Chloroflexota bacterium]